MNDRHRLSGVLKDDPWHFDLELKFEKQSAIALGSNRAHEIPV